MNSDLPPPVPWGFPERDPAPASHRHKLVYVDPLPGSLCMWACFEISAKSARLAFLGVKEREPHSKEYQHLLHRALSQDEALVWA